ncbi:hypothetical protein J2W98_000201 [Paenibacillus peoriae]|uniref:Uncharacterized protein n=1 Tax=Paenibacillus peoriae TaxID=59893 RepID=A0ABU1Q9P4_9BACL|nr:hypothetical protein [Paenibacillus peoriae]
MTTIYWIIGNRAMFLSLDIPSMSRQHIDQTIRRDMR